VWGLIFFACSQSFNLEYRLIGQETNWGYTNQRSGEWAAKSDHTEDVLFFGSSTCYSGIDPHALEAFGLRGFNFCSSSQNVGNSLHLIEAALEEAAPELLVLDVYPKIWGAHQGGFESTKDWMTNSNLRGGNWSSAYRAMAWESRDLFTLVQTVYYDAIRPFRKAGSNPHLGEDENGVYRGLGWVERTFPTIDSIECETERVEMTSYECGAVESIRSLCEARGIQLILLNPPQLCEEEFDTLACFEELTYIDGNRWPGAKTPPNYYDDHHLVGAGAHDYSAWLARELADLHHAHP
jgi:hypothetical protein